MERKIKLLKESYEISKKLYSKTIAKNIELLNELRENDYIYFSSKIQRTPEVFRVIETLNEEIIISNEIDDIRIDAMNYNIEFFEASFLIIEKN